MRSAQKWLGCAGGRRRVRRDDAAGEPPARRGVHGAAHGQRHGTGLSQDPAPPAKGRPHRPSGRAFAQPAEQRVVRQNGRRVGTRPLPRARSGRAGLHARRCRPEGAGAKMDRLDAGQPAGERRLRPVRHGSVGAHPDAAGRPGLRRSDGRPARDAVFRPFPALRAENAAQNARRPRLVGGAADRR